MSINSSPLRIFLIFFSIRPTFFFHTFSISVQIFFPVVPVRRFIATISIELGKETTNKNKEYAIKKI